MLKVFITIDTEIWCKGWKDLDQKFPEYYKKYVYGTTADGDCALPETLKILNDYDLPAVFFVEPLFSAKFGLEPLREMVELIQKYNQEIQLHLHPEWVDKAEYSLLHDFTGSSPSMSSFTLQQQETLISWGLNRLEQVGVKNINAFRAGSYAANSDTLRAVANNGLTFDTSYNLASTVGVKDISKGEPLTQPRYIDGVYEYPVSIFEGKNKKRILQITACSYKEFVSYLNEAYEQKWDSVVIVTHNFELLSPDKLHLDKLVHRRFIKICKYLHENKERFDTRGFQNLSPADIPNQPETIKSNRFDVGLRFAEQILRHLLYR